MRELLERLLADVTLPRMIRYEQTFPDRHVGDPGAAMRAQLAANPAAAAIRPGMRVALSVGSRGIAALPAQVAAIVAEVRRRGAHPFIVPAMGSHGGATAEGQTGVLASLGVTESSAGCPIRSSMETVEVGRLDNGMAVRMDRWAQEADGIIVFNRIKPHNAFRSAHESGLVKMLAIGLGKQSGADQCHRMGFGHMGRLIAEMARVKLQNSPILLGIGVVENACKHIHDIVITPPRDLMAQDAQALLLARELMPSLPVQRLDLLLVDYIGKEFSGGGMDGNVVGRYNTPFISGGPTVTTIVVFDVTDKSAGNANGVGAADIITERLTARYDRQSVYANCLTSRVPISGKLPLAMPTQRMAVLAGLKICCALELGDVRFLRIANSQHVTRGYASEALLPELRANPRVTLCGEPQPMAFTPDGDLADPWW